MFWVSCNNSRIAIAEKDMSTKIVPAMPFFAHSDKVASLPCDPFFVCSYLRNACGYLITNPKTSYKKVQEKITVVVA
jgi:hypothetical protein